MGATALQRKTQRAIAKRLARLFGKPLRQRIAEDILRFPRADDAFIATRCDCHERTVAKWRKEFRGKKP